MSQKVVTLGLVGIEYADIATDGGVGTSFSAVAKTYRNSCNIAHEDSQVTEFLSEEDDEPIEALVSPGRKIYTYQVMNTDPEVQQFFMGGTVDAASGNDPAVWHAPDVMPTIEKSVKFIPKAGPTLTITRARITAKESGQYSREGIGLIDITVRVLKPKKAGEKSMTKTY
jgi:hypothetical protein